MARNTKPVILVTWLDAETTHGWEEDVEADLDQVPVTTIGYLISQNDQSVVIASSISGASNNARMKIPRGMITKMEEVKLLPKKPREQRPQSLVELVLE